MASKILLGSGESLYYELNRIYDFSMFFNEGSETVLSIHFTKFTSHSFTTFTAQSFTKFTVKSFI